MRRQHSAVESAINNLEHRGLDRILSYDTDGFERVTVLAVVAFNRIGLLLRLSPLPENCCFQPVQWTERETHALTSAADNHAIVFSATTPARCTFSL